MIISNVTISNVITLIVTIQNVILSNVTIFNVIMLTVTILNVITFRPDSNYRSCVLTH